MSSAALKWLTFVVFAGVVVLLAFGGTAYGYTAFLLPVALIGHPLVQVLAVIGRSTVQGWLLLAVFLSHGLFATTFAMHATYDGRFEDGLMAALLPLTFDLAVLTGLLCLLLFASWGALFWFRKRG